MAVAAPVPILPMTDISEALRRAQTPTIWRVPRYRGKWVLRRSTVENMLSCAAWRNSMSEDAAFGIWMHEARAHYVRVCQAHREETRLVDVERIARETFYRVPRGLSPNRLREGAELLDRWCRNWPADLATLTRMEFTMAVDIGWAILTGTADREDRMDDDDRADPPRIVRLEDYKTHWGVADHTFQMRFYAWLRAHEPYEGIDDLEEIQVRIIHPRRGDDPIEDYWTRDDWQPGGLLADWWEEEVAKPLTDMWPRRRKLGPTGGSACQYCAKRLTCGQAAGAAAHAPRTWEEFIAHFQELLRVDAAAKELRDGMRLFFRDRADGTALGYQVGPLLPREEQELVVLDGHDEDVVQAMNEVQPGAGDLARRTGVNPRLIPPEWWPYLTEQGFVAVRDKKREVKYRKDIRKGYRDDDGESLGEDTVLAAGPADSTIRVLDGGSL